jgi:TatD DNase family protein
VSTVTLVDSHCHLDFTDFANDLGGVMERADAAGIGLMVTISTRVRQFDRIRALVERFPNVYGTVGTHPHNAHEELDVSADALAKMAEHPKIVGIGEAGLDYHYDNSPREAQERGLRTHIEAARATGLPLVIHSRDADERMIRVLDEESARGPFPGVLHCFSSGAALAQAGLDLGLYLSFSGILTFKKSEALREIAAAAPADRLLVETDAPYLAPEGHRGRRNEPSYVRRTAESLAAARGVTLETIAAETTSNFLTLFNKVPAAAARRAA